MLFLRDKSGAKTSSRMVAAGVVCALCAHRLVKVTGKEGRMGYIMRRSGSGYGQPWFVYRLDKVGFHVDLT